MLTSSQSLADFEEVFMHGSATSRLSDARLTYVDDVRSLVIFLVVMLHSSVTYSGLGGWYIVENKSDSIDPVSKAVFGLFNSFNQAWFMGILFFFGGYFAAESLARKGSLQFIKDRLLRLGLPLLVYVFAIDPLMLYYIAYPSEARAMVAF
jgi:glucans biosynthesis protein C